MSEDALFLTGGEMGRRISEFHWSATALGPVSAWPDELRGVVAMMLNTPMAICLSWGPDLTLLYNDAYIPFLGKRHGSALGRPISEVWFDIWDTIGPWIEQAMAGTPLRGEDSHLVVKRNGYDEDTYWSFAYSRLEDASGQARGFINIANETTEKVLAERRNETEQVRLRQLFDQAPSFMAMLIGPDHRIELTNSEYLKLIGHRDVIGKTVAESLGDAAAQGYLDLLDDVYRTGKPYVGTNAKYAVQAIAGGLVTDRYLDFVYQAMVDEMGKPYGVFVNGIDVTERYNQEITRDVLNRELVHRIKNTLAITSAVVTSSMRHAASLDEARETISARIDALGRTQSLLLRPQGNASVEEVIREAIYPHVDDWARLTVQGPDVSVSAQQAIGLSLAIYELATNAVKYGALSGPTGKVSIEWVSGDDGDFELRWSEREGPQVTQPTRSGFGSRLTNRIVAAYFSGTGETTYDPKGVSFVLRGKARSDSGDADATV